MQQEVQARAQEHGFRQSVGAIGLGVFANACSPGADVTAVWYLRLNVANAMSDPDAVIGVDARRQTR